MAAKSSRIRLYVDHPLATSERVALSRDQAHYLFGVMRLEVGDTVALFNGRDGEWQARIIAAAKKNGVLECEAQTRPLQMPPDLWLVFAPIRKERTAFIVEKAVELGAARLIPMQTGFTQAANRLRQDKLQATALEAAEQCEATYLPPVDPVQRFDRLLDDWDPARRILFGDETLAGTPATLPNEAGPWAIFIGPEGGFTEAERDRLRGMNCAHPVSLGPRILRAETAALAALTLWQAHLGDWQ
ncbi:16S rRNA (uracil(1498)-N(3))-methyltransferase [Thalassorhabdomicrobium marinisediminis]|uniref:16S rRNA (uracil(1498)-N(3))-methyltransferase n=1 Tax=Thalassorhabdomicrobium marinisediminis TaxID=2170577 RepID=UPI0024900113|nr:16S rRNA (uracil(1498)-N(3))-methyltransferase [Thalassorhabdomicrobium marinisediminis]